MNLYINTTNNVKVVVKDCGYSSVAECLPGMWEALGLLPSITVEARPGQEIDRIKMLTEFLFMCSLFLNIHLCV